MNKRTHFPKYSRSPKEKLTKIKNMSLQKKPKITKEKFEKI